MILDYWFSVHLPSKFSKEAILEVAKPNGMGSD
jgi:hypothetical protein